MTNFEKYKDDLLKMNGDFAVDKKTKEIAECNTLGDAERGIDCVDCIFFNGNCYDSDKLKWLCEEYKEPILSDDELELIKAISKLAGVNYKYIIRDAYGVVRFFEAKPRVNKSGNYCGEYTYADIAGDKFLFLSNITYRDGLYDIENKCFIKEEREEK